MREHLTRLSLPNKPMSDEEKLHHVLTTGATILQCVSDGIPLKRLVKKAHTAATNNPTRTTTGDSIVLMSYSQAQHLVGRELIAKGFGKKVEPQKYAITITEEIQQRIFDTTIDVIQENILINLALSNQES